MNCIAKYISNMSNTQNLENNTIEFEDSRRGNHAKNWQFPLKFDKFSGVLRDLAPDIPFKAEDIDNLMNPLESLEDIINRKKKEGKKLKTIDRMRLENIEKRKKEAIANDMKQLDKSCMKVHAKTHEGKELQLLMILQYAIKKGKNDIVANCFIKLLGKNISKENKIKFHNDLQSMYSIVSSLDIVELQLTKFSNQLPPLDRNEFILDPWQKEVITYIDNKESVIVMCPTSSGKTVLSTYVTSCDEKILFVVPTEALAMQVGAHFTKVLGTVVAIETDNTHTLNDPVENDKLLLESPVIVGTPLAIETAITKTGCNFGYVVFDEIHNLDLDQGEAIERICKLTQGIPFLALSATIGNLEELHTWWQSFTEKEIKKVVYTGRFFNLQKAFYRNTTDEIIAVNPLSMVSEQDFIDKSILNKNLQMTPTDIYTLMEKMEEIIDLEELSKDNYFDINVRISLYDCNIYFNKLIKKLVDIYHEDEEGVEIVRTLISNFKMNELEEEEVNVMKLMVKLKDSALLPAICFQMNNISCFKIAMDLLTKLEEAEDSKYPDFKKNKEKKMKQWKKWNDKNEKQKAEMTEKQFVKHVAKGDEELEYVEKPDLSAPHPEFIIAKSQFFTEDKIKEIKWMLKYDFKGYGDELHPVIRALYRGIGIYINGMPHSYLRLVQKLAQQKKLGVVFSDEQLAFGVSMPFKTSCLFKDIHQPDTLNSLLNLQASGRAGRRGLDTEGYVIYAGYSWDRMVDLCISALPRIVGKNYCYPLMSLHEKICNIIHGDSKYKPKTDQIKTLPLNNELTEEISNYNDWSEEKLTKKGGWRWCYVNCDELNEGQKEKAMKYNFMVWNMSRVYPKNAIILPYLLRNLDRVFSSINYTQIKEQIRLAYVLSHFICQEKATDETFILKIDPTWVQHIENLNKFGLEMLTSNIDSKVYSSIESNAIVATSNDLEKFILRKRIWDFGENIRILQNYCFYNKLPLFRIMGKLFTRIWWIYFTSNMIS
jgi:hypothetical protein